MQSNNRALGIIGSTEYVKVGSIENIPAKIDTGADSSSIWASNIEMRDDDVLIFSLFDKKSPLYTGDRLESTNYTAKIVRSSNGDSQIRYCVKLPLTIKGETFETTFTLANRSRNHFPVLIGRRTIENRYLVDVAKSVVNRQENANAPKLNQKLREDPQGFHEEFIVGERS